MISSITATFLTHTHTHMVCSPWDVYEVPTDPGVCVSVLSGCEMDFISHWADEGRSHTHRHTKVFSVALSKITSFIKGQRSGKEWYRKCRLSGGLASSTSCVFLTVGLWFNNFHPASFVHLVTYRLLHSTRHLRLFLFKSYSWNMNPHESEFTAQQYDKWCILL